MPPARANIDHGKIELVLRIACETEHPGDRTARYGVFLPFVFNALLTPIMPLSTSFQNGAPMDIRIPIRSNPTVSLNLSSFTSSAYLEVRSNMGYFRISSVIVWRFLSYISAGFGV